MLNKASILPYLCIFLTIYFPLLVHGQNDFFITVEEVVNPSEPCGRDGSYTIQMHNGTARYTIIEENTITGYTNERTTNSSTLTELCIGGIFRITVIDDLGNQDEVIIEVFDPSNLADAGALRACVELESEIQSCEPLRLGILVQNGQPNLTLQGYIYGYWGQKFDLDYTWTTEDMRSFGISLSFFHAADLLGELRIEDARDQEILIALHFPSTEPKHPDFDALMAIYDALNGENWEHNVLWGVSNCVCEWSYVGCNDDGRINWMSLGDPNTSGSIPNEIGELEFLEYLRIGGTLNYENPEHFDVYGEIPGSIGLLQHLQKIEIFGTDIAFIPSSIQNCPLEIVYFFHNNIQQEFPDFFFNITSLSVLDLSNNNIYGELPLSLQNANNLIWLGMANNQLTGSLPDVFHNFGNTYFDLSNNNLAGCLPPSLSSLCGNYMLLEGNECLYTDIDAFCSGEPCTFTDYSLSPEDPITCSGESIELSASGGQQYSWSTGSNQSQITVTPLENETYYVDLITPQGCERSDSIPVVVIPPIEIDIASTTPASSPTSNDGAIDIIVSGGDGSYDFLWQDENAVTISTDQNPNQLAAGFYTVTVIDETNCSSQLQVEVTSLCAIFGNITITQPIYLLWRTGWKPRTDDRRRIRKYRHSMGSWFI